MILKRLFPAIVIAAMPVMASAGTTAAETTPAQTDTLSVSVARVMASMIRGSIDKLASLGAQVDVDVFGAALAEELKSPSSKELVFEADRYIDSYIRSKQPVVVDTLSVESQQQFLKEMAATPGAITTPSGLVFIIETEGEGPTPTDSDQVDVMYEGRFYDGIVFDKTDSPITFGVKEVTSGFSEGLKLMRPGGRYRIVMPASLGYGAEGIPGAIPGNAALDFTVELIRINQPR